MAGVCTGLTGPTRGAERFERGENWSARPWAARLVRLAVLVIPLAAAVAVAAVIGRVLPAGSGPVAAVARWMGMCAVATAVVIAVERLSRRLLPLAALLDLSLVFPDRAPSRFRVALRANSTRQLSERTQDGAAELDTQRAAEEILAQVSALHRHDRRTRGHSERVRAYSVLIGEELGLPDDDLDRLQWAALLHDIGKLDVPSEILNKDGRPTDEEWETLTRHPGTGARRIAPLEPWLGEWARAVTEHHERWDGRGYPNQIGGQDIALSARIVAVADSFEVMTAARSYKPPMSVAAARKELTACAGAQFDPVVVRAFLNASIGRVHRVLGPLAWVVQLPFVPSTAATIPGAAAAAAGVATVALLAPVLPSTPGGDTADAQARTEQSSPPSRDSELAGATRSGERDEPGDPGASGRNAADPSGAAGGEGGTAEPPAGSAFATPGLVGPGVPGGGRSAGPAPPETFAPPPVAPGPFVAYLGTSGPGDLASSAVLPLQANAPGAPGLPNYDVDRDAAAGLLLKKTDKGVSETDLTKRQLWSYSIGVSTALAGPASVRVWAAMKDFKTDKAARLLAYIQDCPPSLSGCATIASGQAVVDGRSGPGWKDVTVSMGSVDHVIGAGRHLVVRVQVDDNSDDDCWLAYGTHAFPARVAVG